MAEVAGDQTPRRRAAQARRSSPNPALQGSNRPGLGSGMDYVACVIHLSSKEGVFGLGRGARWRWRVCAAVLAGVRRAGHSRAGLSVQKGQEGTLMLTEVQSGLDGRAGSMATLNGGGAKAVLADEVLWLSSGHLDCTSRCVASLRSSSRG